jgi:hypothetical protein
VVDDELRASPEEIGERRRSVVGLEAVILADFDPREFLAQARQLIAAPGQLLLGLKQLEAGGEPSRGVPVL